MKKTGRSWFRAKLIAFSLVLVAVICFFLSMQKTQEVHAATEYKLITSITGSQIAKRNDGLDPSPIYGWEVTGINKISDTEFQSCLKNFYTRLNKSYSGYPSMEQPLTDRVTRIKYSFTVDGGQYDHVEILNGTSYPFEVLYSSTDTSGDVTFEGGLERVYFDIKGNGSDDTELNFRSYSVEAYGTIYSVSATKGTGVSSVYFSENADGSGTQIASGTKVLNRTKLYAFAVLANNYKHQSDWTLVSGTADSQGAVYCVGTKDSLLNDWNVGTVNAIPKQTTITLNKQNGTGGSNSVTATLNSAMPTATMPTRTGYSFQGYYDATSGGTKYYNANGSSAKNWDKSTTTATLYARWSVVTYNITFNRNNGTFVSGYTAPSSYTIESNAITLPTASNIERTGYTFAGWYTASDLSGTAVTSIPKGSTGNKTYYAKWTPNEYTLSFNTDGGSTIADKTVTYNAKYGELDVPTKDGCTFVGWYREPEFVNEVNSNTDVTTAGNHTIYAKYTTNFVIEDADDYNGTYDKNLHSITIHNPTNPIDGYVLKFYNEDTQEYDLDDIPTFDQVGEYTVMYKMTKEGYTDFYDQATVTITKKAVQPGDIFKTPANPITGLVYNRENYTLITAAEFKDDDVYGYGSIVYRVVAADGSANTEYGSELPIGQNATTYTIYYRNTENRNYEIAPETSFTVVISQVDKTNLSQLIENANQYREKIENEYEDYADEIEQKLEELNTLVIDEPNITKNEIFEQYLSFKNQFSDIKVEVAKDKIEKIGEVERTDDSKGLIDDAREYYDDLTPAEREKITTSDTLTTAEKTYDTLVHDYITGVTCGIVFGIIGGILLIGLVFLYILLFVKNKWVIDDKGRVLRAFVCGNKEGEYKLFTIRCKIVTRKEDSIYNTKDEALKALGNNDSEEK